jgi:hypothetical protein
METLVAPPEKPAAQHPLDLADSRSEQRANLLGAGAFRPAIVNV